MSGDWLALAAVAGLAAAGAGQRGSRDLSSPLSVTREGWPWPADYPLFHATTGLRAIQRQRFKTRAQGLDSMLGGGTDEAVSFTLSRGVADGVLVGLVTLRRGARREMSMVDLWRAFERECPKGMRKLAESDTSSSEYTLERAVTLDRHLYRQEPFFGAPLPPGAQSVGRTWMGRDQRMHSAWLRQPATEQQRTKVEEDWDYAFRQLYNALTMYGSSEKECYYPSFWGTKMPGLARLSDDDLGIIQATSRVPRICLSALSAIQLGYLTRAQAVRYEGWLNRTGRDCRDGPDQEARYQARGRQRSYGHSGLLGGYSGPGADEQIGPWRIVDEGKPLGSTSMVAMDSMFEVRVYDPSKVEVTRSSAAVPYLKARGLYGRVSAPWTSDSELSGERVLPGQVLREAVR